MSKSLFKSLSFNDCDLHIHRIDVWQIPLDNEPPWAKSLLNEHEKTRANRYYFPEHQRRFSTARAMLRLILSHYLDTSAQKLVFDYLKQGKPYLPQHPFLQFNLSHSGDTALLAVGHTTPLGIDIEYFSARPYCGMAKHSFSAQENQSLAQLPPWLLPLAFFNVWAQKEAFIKALGLGLSYPTRQFNVPILPQQPALVDDPLHALCWQMVSFIPVVACCAALCCHPDVTDWYYHTLHALPDQPDLSPAVSGKS